jgi:thiosulfate/3-mercaptopyruvate sulfurtransferase
LYDPTTKTFVNPDDAERHFAAQGVTREKQVIAYCGGGISAIIDLLILRRLGYESLMLYDGSMGEWAKDASLPIETG